MEETKIRWTLGYTANMGNFESLRVDLSIEDHIRADETQPQASERIWNTVAAQLVERLNEARRDLT